MQRTLIADQTLFAARPVAADEDLVLRLFAQVPHPLSNPQVTYRSRQLRSALLSVAVGDVSASRLLALEFAKQAKADREADLAERFVDLLAKGALKNTS